MDGLFGNDDLLARLDRWVASARIDEAAAARARERWLRQVAGESATFAGVLLDLAERRSAVAIQSRGGRRTRGIVTGVGADFAALRTMSGTDVLFAFVGIASVRPDDSSSPPTGDRVGTFELGMAEAVAAVAIDRTRVLLVTSSDGDGIAGELRSVGRDVASVRLDGEGGIAYVPLGSIWELVIAR